MKRTPSYLKRTHHQTPIAGHWARVNNAFIIHPLRSKYGPQHVCRWWWCLHPLPPISHHMKRSYKFAFKLMVKISCEPNSRHKLHININGCARSLVFWAWFDGNHLPTATRGPCVSSLALFRRRKHNYEVNLIPLPWCSCDDDDDELEQCWGMCPEASTLLTASASWWIHPGSSWMTDDCTGTACGLCYGDRFTFPQTKIRNSFQTILSRNSLQAAFSTALIQTQASRKIHLKKHFYFVWTILLRGGKKQHLAYWGCCLVGIQGLLLRTHTITLTGWYTLEKSSVSKATMFSLIFW